MDVPPGLLFVLPWPLDTASGVNQVVIHLAREAARRGRLRPVIFSPDHAAAGFSTRESEGVTLLSGPLPAPLAGRGLARALATFGRHLRRELQEWRALLKEHGIQVINPHTADPGCWIFPLLRGRGGRRLVFSLHGPDITALHEAGPGAHALARRMLRRADAVTCCSEDLARRVQAELGLSEQLVRTAYNGIDVEELDQSRTEPYRPDTGGFDNYLVNVATFEPSKGQDVLLQAFTQLLREGLRSALVLIGRSTPYLATLRGMVRQLGLQDHVTILPDLDHSRTLAAIRQARLLVQPSRDEAFGITLLEAGYLGTPIVATRTGGIPEVLGGYYPYLASPDDPDALAAAIDEALFNPTDTERQVGLIRRRVSTQFTWGTAYRTYEALWLDAG